MKINEVYKHAKDAVDAAEAHAVLRDLDMGIYWHEDGYEVHKYDSRKQSTIIEVVRTP